MNRKTKVLDHNKIKENGKMNEFNLWDLWDFSEVEIKRTDGKIYKGR
jgi:hypothetical protein